MATEVYRLCVCRGAALVTVVSASGIVQLTVRGTLSRRERQEDGRGCAPNCGEGAGERTLDVSISRTWTCALSADQGQSVCVSVDIGLSPDGARLDTLDSSLSEKGVLIVNQCE